MVAFSTNEFKPGLKLIIDDAPCIIIESEFTKPGKGQAFTRIKFRNLKNQRVLERRYKSGQSLEGADIVELEVQYLYNDGALWYFMDQHSFEQYTIDQGSMTETAPWLKGEELCIIMLWDDMPLSVQAPNFVTLKVTDTEPELKGNTMAGATKPATLETGAVVKVPLFIGVGEQIKIDTRKGNYVSRA